jgi:catechol 2,3-dioxygenase-like lactoylglutathione lyase family enzyme
VDPRAAARRAAKQAGGRLSAPDAPGRVLETCVYAADLPAAERFYVEGRHIFFRAGPGMFLVFAPAATATAPGQVGGVPVPAHGASGAGHVAFAVAEEALDGWRAHLAAHGVAVEAEIAWPRGGRSLYVRDPAGNSVELATPRIWGLVE